MQNCIDACQECIKLFESKKNKNACYKACVDCVNICSFILKTKIHCKENEANLLKACIACCKICIIESEKHAKQSRVCKQCMEECSKCIQHIYLKHSKVIS